MTSEDEARGAGGGATAGGEGPVGEVLPEFALVDVNPASTTYEGPVSPRDYLEMVSGWYFGHAT